MSERASLIDRDSVDPTNAIGLTGLSARTGRQATSGTQNAQTAKLRLPETVKRMRRGIRDSVFLSLTAPSGGRGWPSVESGSCDVRSKIPGGGFLGGGAASGARRLATGRLQLVSREDADADARSLAASIRVRDDERPAVRCQGALFSRAHRELARG